MKYIIATVFLLIPSFLFGQNIQLFNPDTFGKSIDKPVVFLFESSSNATKPLSIEVDVKNGKYYGATITYPNLVTFDCVKKAIRSKYKDLEESKFDERMFSLRNKTKKYAIQLTDSKCYIQVIYIPFIKSVIKSN